MTARPILHWPHPALRTPATPVAEVDDTILSHWQDMIDTMEAMPGVGLAAPQIGLGLSLCVVDASDDRGRAVRLANPEILSTSPDVEAGPEASPCLPGVSADIVRPTRAEIAFDDHTGTRTSRTFVDLWARSVLHQIDHLNGRMYFDNLSRTRRDMLLKRARKRAS